MFRVRVKSFFSLGGRLVVDAIKAEGSEVKQAVVSRSPASLCVCVLTGRSQVLLLEGSCDPCAAVFVVGVASIVR